jgi:hypothetical protein
MTIRLHVVARATNVLDRDGIFLLLLVVLHNECNRQRPPDPTIFGGAELKSRACRALATLRLPNDEEEEETEPTVVRPPTVRESPTRRRRDMLAKGRSGAAVLWMVGAFRRSSQN